MRPDLRRGGPVVAVVAVAAVAAAVAAADDKTVGSSGF